MNKTTITVIVALAVMTLSASAVVYYFVCVPQMYPPTYIVDAQKLTETPQTYMAINQSDATVIGAVSNLQEGFWVHSLEDTQIDELINQQIMANNTNNFHVNGEFYRIGIIDVDAFPPTYILVMFPVSLVALPLSTVIFIVAAVVKLVKRSGLTKETKV